MKRCPIYLIPLVHLEPKIEQNFDHLKILLSAIRGGQMQERPASFRPPERVRTCGDQHSHCEKVASRGSTGKRRRPGASLQQERDDFKGISACRLVQRRRSARLLQGDIGAVFKQEPYKFRFAPLSRFMQRRPILRIALVNGSLNTN